MIYTIPSAHHKHTHTPSPSIHTTKAALKNPIPYTIMSSQNPLHETESTQTQQTHESKNPNPQTTQESQKPSHEESNTITKPHHHQESPHDRAAPPEEEGKRGAAAPPAKSEAEEGGRERLKRHRVEMAGRVWIPDMWGQEDLLKDWIDCAAFDASLVSSPILMARDSLAQQGRRAANSTRLRIQN